MRRAAAIVALVSTIAAAPAVRAQSGMLAPPTPPPPVDDGNFGGQVAGADVLGFATSVVLLGTGSPAAVLPYLLAAPTVHALHGDAAGAGASFLLNAFGPLAFGYLGYRLDSRGCGSDEDGCGTIGILLGALVGFAVATGVDCAWFSPPKGAATDPAPQKPKADVSPSFAFEPGGHFSLGLVGRF